MHNDDRKIQVVGILQSFSRASSRYLRGMDRSIVSAALRRDFFPALKEDGFRRVGNVMRRIHEPVVHVVEVVHRPARGVFRVDMGVHLTLLGDVSGQAIDATTLRESGCAWRQSVIPGFLNDFDPDFVYGTTIEDAEESVQFLASEWVRQSSEFFGPLTRWPDQFLDAARKDSDENSAHPATLRTWARVAALAGDLELARTCAERALPRVPESATSLRADLEEFISDPSRAAKPAR